MTTRCHADKFASVFHKKFFVKTQKKNPGWFYVWLHTQTPWGEHTIFFGPVRILKIVYF